KEIDYCRVDLMLKGDDIYFSEITLSPKRGKLKITPSIWDAKLGSMWDLSLAKTGSIEPVYSCPQTGHESLKSEPFSGVKL
ncbi:ATP-grasp fold amidoligase family protein, partial [Klebsiella pneumoniae]